LGTIRVPQLQQRFCVTDRAGVQPLGRCQRSRKRILTCNQAAMRSPGLPFNGLHPRIQGLHWWQLIYRPCRDGRL